MNYRLLSVAEAELAETARWYESQCPNLGHDFLDEFEAVMGRIMRFPLAWTKVSERHRRCLFRRFPYAVLYSQTATEVTVAGVIDLRKNPEHLEERKKKTG